MSSIKVMKIKKQKKKISVHVLVRLHFTYAITVFSCLTIIPKGNLESRCRNFNLGVKNVCPNAKGNIHKCKSSEKFEKETVMGKEGKVQRSENFKFKD